MRCLPPVDQRAARLEMMDASRKQQDALGLAVLPRWTFLEKCSRKWPSQAVGVGKDDPLIRPVSLCQPVGARHWKKQHFEEPLSSKLHKKFQINPTDSWFLVQEKHISFLGGGFKYFLFSPLTWGNDPVWRSYFSDGLKRPTSFGWWNFPPLK